MVSNIVRIVLVVVIIGWAVSLESCYYDNEEYLYGSGCDTITSFTYQNKIKGIMDTRCATPACHGGTSPANDLSLTSYSGVKAGFETMSMMCNIRHESGCVPMPKNESQLSKCDIRALEKWQANGYPEN
jgi:hypothetical protein